VPSNLTQEQLLQIALDAIDAELGPLVEEGRVEIPGRLKILAEETVRYWTASMTAATEAEKAEAEKDLEFLQSEARMITTRYALKGQAAAARTAERVIGEIARIGFMVLKAALGVPSLPV